jgi:NADH:ubiquinone oxidoreductase subunit 5 (subunit L)/multisubunit Na+/H+ antiporter MnhA subunit
MCADPYRPPSYGRESLVFQSLKSFLIALFGVMGLLIGFVLTFALIGAISDATEGQSETCFKPEIAANGNGQRVVQSSKSPVILKINILLFVIKPFGRFKNSSTT